MIRSTFIVLISLGLFASSYAGKCTGNPPMYNGLPCATTTRYWDGQMGACGCGTGNQSPFSWQWTTYTAAASQLAYDSTGSEWCGSGCGACYELTPTGDCPYGGNCAQNPNPITIMITNLCPYIGNEQWCPNPGQLNNDGYGQHFDLMDYNLAGQISALGWNNPVVTYRRVACGGGGSASCQQAESCQCNSVTSKSCAAGGSQSASSSATTATTSSTAATTATTATTSSTAATTATTATTASAATTATTATTSSAATTATTATTSSAATSSTASTATTSSTATTATSSSVASTASSSTSATSSSTGEPASISTSTTSSELPPPAGSTVGRCTAGVSFALVSTWFNGGLVLLSISNTGSQPIRNLRIHVPGNNINSWNLVPTEEPEMYTLPDWAVIQPGQTYTSTGYTFNGLQPASGYLASVSC